MSDKIVNGKLEGLSLQLDQPFVYPVHCGSCGHPTESGHVCQSGTGFVEATLKRIEAKLDRIAPVVDYELIKAIGKRLQYEHVDPNSIIARTIQATIDELWSAR